MAANLSTTSKKIDTILVLDFGSQYTQLIARRVRDSNVYSEILPWDIDEEKIKYINPKGIKELDMRETGGFIPPVGVKEKEDDIPAMLSNNEFVFTADAVRGMGDGDVDKGAERMYSMMKKLEDGGRV